MEHKTTNRGFDYFEFVDDNGITCTLQKSSSALKDKIWLGIDEAEPIIMASKVIKNGTGWVKYPIHPDVQISTRMHLTRDQVKCILPILKLFVETGSITKESE